MLGDGAEVGLVGGDTSPSQKPPPGGVGGEEGVEVEDLRDLPCIRWFTHGSVLSVLAGEPHVSHAGRPHLFVSPTLEAG